MLYEVITREITRVDVSVSLGVRQAIDGLNPFSVKVVFCHFDVNELSYPKL